MNVVSSVRSPLLSDAFVPGRRTAREKAIWAFMVVQFLALTIFQKIGIPAGGIAVSVSIPLLWGGLALLAVQGWARIDLSRALLLALFLIFAFIGLAALEDFSIASFGLVLAIYIPMLFTIRVSESLFLRIMRLFVNLALLTVPVIFLQWGLQYAIRPGLWFNIETVIPRPFLIPDYYYERLVEYGSLFAKPNGIFFLEVSILSQILALAIVVELVCFGGVGRLIALSAALLATTAGTGILLLSICAPLLLPYLPRRAVLLAVVAGVAGVLYLMFFGVPAVFDRLSEFRSDAHSGYFRFVGPLLILDEFLQRSDVLWKGLGPGSGPEDGIFVLPPFIKIVFEYGVLASLAFYAFLVVSMFRRAYSFVISFAVFVFYNFLGGGLAVPFYGIAVILLSTLFRVQPEPVQAQRPEQ